MKVLKIQKSQNLQFAGNKKPKIGKNWRVLKPSPEIELRIEKQIIKNRGKRIQDEYNALQRDKDIKYK